MCRFFANLSVEPESPLIPLVESPGSLLAKSRANDRHPHADGWGIGWFDTREPRVYKDPAPLFEAANSARQLAEGISAKTFVGHVREASNPGGLSKQDLIGLVHTQPFFHEEWLFVHNGTFYLADEVRESLGSLGSFIEGRNDSEVLFYWLLKTVIFARSGSYADRLERGLRELDHLWEKTRGRHKDAPYAYKGLNLVLTNGDYAFCFCCEKPGGFGEDKAFFSRSVPFYQMHMQLDSRRFLIASEPWIEPNSWIPLPHGQLIEVRRKSSGLEMDIHPIDHLIHA